MVPKANGNAHPDTTHYIPIITLVITTTITLVITAIITLVTTAIITASLRMYGEAFAALENRKNHPLVEVSV